MVALPMTHEGRLVHRGHAVWWGSVGADEDRIPVLTVHGGPGICHDCLEPLGALADERRVVFYDQYGCGRSDRATDPAEYDIELFVDELAAVRAALGLERVHLFAHSYGGALALEYLLSRGTEGVQSLTLSNTYASMPGLVAGWGERLDTLGAEARAVLTAADPDPETYGATLGEFVRRFVFPSEMPEPVVRSQAGSGAEVYARMHGSSWFVPDGRWAGWDATDRLPGLGVPTLVITGSRDQVVPELGAAIADRVPGAQLAELDAAHLPFFEVPDEFLALVRAHLRRTESAIAG